MKIVIRAVLERCELSPAGDGAEKTRRRSITISPARGGRVVLRDRMAADGSQARPSASVAAIA
jgi:hypothetical protein